MNTVAQIEQRVYRRVRRTPFELTSEIRNIVNSAQDQICQRKPYWFLDLEQTFPITVGSGNWWELTLPALFDSPLDAWEIVTPNKNVITYMTFAEASTIYPIPSTTSPRGQIQNYSESDDYLKALLWPVPIQNTSFYLRYRAKSLPALVDNGDHNILTDEYAELLITWAEGLAWRHLGENGRAERLLNEPNGVAILLARQTIDRQNARRKLRGIQETGLPIRTGALGISRYGARRRFL
jgi:hypothetical protein